MAADTADFVWRIEAGEREILTFPVLKDGVPFAIPGQSVDAKIKTRPGGAVLYTFPAELAVVSVDGLEVELTLPAEVTTAFAFTSGWYRVKVSDNAVTDPDVQRLLQGAFVVDPD